LPIYIKKTIPIEVIIENKRIIDLLKYILLLAHNRERLMELNLAISIIKMLIKKS
jgi:hypothetical protein